MSLPPITLGYPVPGKPLLTSGFGQRKNPITGAPAQVHMGQDFGVFNGSTLVCAADGHVWAAGLGVAGDNPDETYGLRVVVEHAGGWFTTYNHLLELGLLGMPAPLIALSVARTAPEFPALLAWYRGLSVPKAGGRFGHEPLLKGLPVLAGQPIGKSGGVPGDPRSGITTGPHLHFELRRELPARTFYDPAFALPGGRGVDFSPSWIFGSKTITLPKGP